jgi:adenine-specific DNA-methyltransferase
LEHLDLDSKDVLKEKIEELQEIYIAKQYSNSKARSHDKIQDEDSENENENEIPEKYEFTWPGKQNAKKIAFVQTSATLRPCEKESLNFETTENLYIEGDNLEVLKILQKSYYNKIKMIYIDPPYNTGKDFIYPDNFTDSIKNYKKITGQTLKSNPETNGRFHSKWLNMMYPRLILARELLADDGVIFISIDDNEQANLKLVCDEVFGEGNFVACFARKTVSYVTTKSDAELQILNDYILTYKNSKLNFNKKIVGEKTYPYEDKRGKFYIVPLQDNGPHGTRTARPNLYYPIYELPNGDLTYNETENYSKKILPKNHKNDEGRWMWSKKKFDSNWEDLFIKDEEIFIKHYYNPNEDQNKYLSENTWLDKFQNSLGSKCLNNLGLKGYFNYPKPIELLKHIIKLSTNSDSIILDFFSGSATTAHAVMQLNAEDGGNRKFIMVQLPEICDESTMAFKAGYKNICEIGKERIRRAGKKILAENPGKQIDVGFKVFKLDSSK